MIKRNVNFRWYVHVAIQSNSAINFQSFDAETWPDNLVAKLTHMLRYASPQFSFLGCPMSVGIHFHNY